MRNDSFSLKFYLLTDKKLNNGELPIYLRIRVNRVKVEMSTRLVLKNESDWDETTQRVRYKGPVNSELNQIEAQVTNYYHELKHTNKPISAIILKELYLGRGERTISLKSFLQTSIKERILENKELSSNTTKNYTTTLIHLNGFLEESQQKNISIQDINESFLRKWDTYLVNKALLINSM
ncbi:MAG: phage integrase SAM-like domain-containing protein [Sphingobacteriaceae bacterium]|nr:phage integrase SAM-like domain-containing protein [Sphingobacteriaceae bacterium]